MLPAKLCAGVPAELQGSMKHFKCLSSFLTRGHCCLVPGLCSGAARCAAPAVSMHLECTWTHPWHWISHLQQGMP